MDLRRAAVITAVRERRSTAGRLRVELAAQARPPGRARPGALPDLLEGGCESELEIWGHREVVHGPAFAGRRWQERVQLGGRSVRLDLYDEAAQLAVEPDGRRTTTGRATASATSDVTPASPSGGC
ncbi:hypothetical protein [uncultured Pseudokineococcus sp.]|uniref:hypothetical protein n=1 Tax=uncultured Pseudokineococcus sp. TaxID=1642928 RepID=UPI00261D1878|nr:hypothetical protein [uncultured Pseudokineococcus sp.]